MLGFILSRPLKSKLLPLLLGIHGLCLPKLSPPAQLQAPSDRGTHIFSICTSVKLPVIWAKAGIIHRRIYTGINWRTVLGTFQLSCQEGKQQLFCCLDIVPCPKARLAASNGLHQVPHATSPGNATFQRKQNSDHVHISFILTLLEFEKVE